jgi:DNA-binding transcriptional ArsR family regulator
MDISQAVAGLGALAQESRLVVFRLLVQHGQAGLPAGEISRASGIPPTTLSFHLSQLSRARLVSVRRAGRLLIYSADFEAARELVAFLLENCCQAARPPAQAEGVMVKGAVRRAAAREKGRVS